MHRGITGLIPMVTLTMAITLLMVIMAIADGMGMAGIDRGVTTGTGK